MAKYLDENGLLYFWQKIKAVFALKTEIPTVPSASSTTPKMNGAAATGSETAWSRGDHVHPSDTTKVDKVTGKGLSTNDFTTTLKNKLDGIASGAEVNVQADWNESDSTSDAFILNKPTIPSAVTVETAFSKTSTNPLQNKVITNGLLQAVTVDRDATKVDLNGYTPKNDFLTTDSILAASTELAGVMTAADKTKLDGIATGAEVNVNADWSASSGDAQILNKPTLGAAAAKGVVTSISSDSANLPTVTAVKNYVSSAVTGATAFQGTAPTSFAPTNYKAGYYWVVQTAGTYVGETCEVGDMIFAVADYSSAYSASDFEVIQNNLITITNAEIDTILAS